MNVKYNCFTNERNNNFFLNEKSVSNQLITIQIPTHNKLLALCRYKTKLYPYTCFKWKHNVEKIGNKFIFYATINLKENIPEIPNRICLCGSKILIIKLIH